MMYIHAKNILSKDAKKSFSSPVSEDKQTWWMVWSTLENLFES